MTAPGSITAELTAVPKANCTLCRYISTQTMEDQAELHANLRQPVEVVRNLAVVAYLARRGIAIDETSVRRHRRNHEHQ